MCYKRSSRKWKDNPQNADKTMYPIRDLSLKYIKRLITQALKIDKFILKVDK